jgi:hypothetical protein
LQLLKNDSAFTELAVVNADGREVLKFSKSERYAGRTFAIRAVPNHLAKRVAARRFSLMVPPPSRRSPLSPWLFRSVQNQRTAAAF